jgi:hypothetical protein
VSSLGVKTFALTTSQESHVCTPGPQQGVEPKL